jgi:hypothetical protein
VSKSDQPLWKELYTQALMESDSKKVTLVLFATELAMTERYRQLLDSPDHHERTYRVGRRKGGFGNYPISQARLASGCTKLIFTSDGCRSYLAVPY